jgi:hypothetical protein
MLTRAESLGNLESLLVVAALTFVCFASLLHAVSYFRRANVWIRLLLPTSYTLRT